MTGEYRNTVDEKGRLMIPPKLRNEIGSAFMLTKSPDGTLWLFKNEDFRKLEELLNDNPMSMFNKGVIALNRCIIAPAHDVELDKAGRLSIPQDFRKYSGLECKTECVILASRFYVEIISVEKYEKVLAEAMENMSDIADQVSQICRGK